MTTEPRTETTTGQHAEPTFRLDVRADAFTAAYSAVSLAASTDESRRILTAVVLEVTETGARMFATDSYRLHLAEITDTVFNYPAASGEDQREPDVNAHGLPVGTCVSWPASALKATEVRRLAKLVTARRAIAPGYITVTADHYRPASDQRAEEAPISLGATERKELPGVPAVLGGLTVQSLHDQDYPDVDKLLTEVTGEPEVPCRFNSSYLADVAKACSFVAANGTTTVEMVREMKPARFSAASDDLGVKLSALLMPVRL